MDRTIRISARAVLNGVVMLLLFLATLNTINRYYYFIFIAFGLFLLRPGRKVNLNAAVIPLFILALSWVVFAPSATDSVFGPLKPFAYMLSYILGYSLLSDAEQAPDGALSFKPFYQLIGAVAAGPFVHYLLNWLKNGNAEDRNTIDFWSNIALAATGQAALACLPLAVAVACLFIKVGKGLKFVSIVALGAILLYNLILAGRTLLVLLVIVVAVAFLYRLLYRKGRFWAIALMAVTIAAILFAFRANVFGIRDFVESSALYTRFFGKFGMGVTEDGRLDRKLFFLNNLMDYPFGGAHMRSYVGYAHDIFLDTFDEAGVFALLAVVAYIFMSLGRMLRCIFDKAISFEFRMVVLCVYVVLYVEFMVEPILQGMPWLFAAFCLIDGYVARLLAARQRGDRC